KIKGFRPGKAPYAQVVQEVGEMQVMQTAANLAISKVVFEHLEKEDIETIDQPAIEVIKLAPNNPFIFKATLALMPKVEIADYATINVKALPEIKIEKKEIDKTIEDLKKMRGKETIADKAAEKGDKVELDFDTFMDNVPIEHGSAKKHMLTVGENRMIPGFEENIEGMKKDEEKEFNLPFPKEYHEKSLAGKMATFKIKVLAVYKIELPTIDDAFAKELGLKDLKTLNSHVESNIRKEKQVKEDQKQELEMINALIEKSKFDELPEVLINQEVHKMVHELEDNVTRQGMDFKNYLEHIKKTEADLKLDFAPDAVKRVKTAVLIRDIAQKEKLEVSEAEVNEEVERTLASYKMNPAYAAQIDELEKNIKSDNAKQYFKNLIINRKTIKFLKDTIIK
ncbi:trigger factor, partial [Candidatus Woesearchaeota archaeon]|nr:trigger factor [Candidatus Woesearchaeota archaeon]